MGEPGRKGARCRYATVAVVFLNVLLLFGALNLAVHWGSRLGSKVSGAGLGDVVARYGLEKVARAYPELSRADLVSFLGEAPALLRWEYEPFTEFRQVPVRGRFVNVDAAGFRAIREQGPWPPEPGAATVFVFGGSTTFGVGLPDGGTIPSHLQEALRQRLPGRRIDVYNFARSSYFSTQERLLFEQLLLSGSVPTAAVFVDGLNDTINLDSGLPPLRWKAARSTALRTLVEEANGSAARHHLLGLFRDLPLPRRIGAALRERPSIRGAAIEAGIRERREAEPALIDRWRRNKALIESAARSFHARTLFVWQPIPSFRYDLRYHLFPGDVREVLEPSAHLYASIEPILRAPGSGALWLADAQVGRTENLYVDDLHYTSAFCKDLAASIADALVRDGLLDAGRDR